MSVGGGISLQCVFRVGEYYSVALREEGAGLGRFLYADLYVSFQDRPG